MARHRRRRHRRHHARRKLTNPRRRFHFRSRRRRMRNPRRASGGGFGNMLSVKGATHALVPAVTGALGAMAVDIGMAYVPLPTQLQSGWGKTLAQLIGALGLGFIAAKVPFIGKRNAQLGTLGALTVIAYGAIRPLAAQTIGANVKGLSGLADFGDYTPSMGAYMNPRLGAYMNPAPMLLQGPGASTPMARKQMAGFAGGYSDDMFG